MPNIYSRRQKGIPKGAIYVGRPTKWGNPHIIHTWCATCQKQHSREEAIALFRAELSPELKAMARNELRGKDLVCWCRPLSCHAEVLVEVAND